MFSSGLILQYCVAQARHWRESVDETASNWERPHLVYRLSDLPTNTTPAAYACGVGNEPLDFSWLFRDSAAAQTSTGALGSSQPAMTMNFEFVGGEMAYAHRHSVDSASGGRTLFSERSSRVNPFDFSKRQCSYEDYFVARPGLPNLYLNVAVYNDFSRFQDRGVTTGTISHVLILFVYFNLLIVLVCRGGRRRSLEHRCWLLCDFIQSSLLHYTRTEYSSNFCLVGSVRGVA